MPFYSPKIQKLIEEFTKFPGIGKKSAERFIFYLLNKDKSQIAEIAHLIQEIQNEFHICPTCFNISSNENCPICNNGERSQGVVCIVEKSQDLQAIESTGQYQGVYHVLGGKIDTFEPENSRGVKVKQLAQRIKNNQPQIHEIIFAINPDIDGESTILYLSNLIKKLNPKIKLSRLAQGLPTGSEIEYADQATISNSLKNRNKLWGGRN